MSEEQVKVSMQSEQMETDKPQMKMALDTAKSDEIRNANAEPRAHATVEVSLKAAADAVEKQVAVHKESSSNLGTSNDPMVIDDIDPAPATAVTKPIEVNELVVESNSSHGASTLQENGTAGDAEDRKRAQQNSYDDDEVPSKKNKTESRPSSPMDNSHALVTEMNTTSDETVQTKPTSIPNDHPDAANSPSGTELTNDEGNISCYQNTEPSIAKLIEDKLETINEVVPLKPLSLRDLAELENALQLGDKYEYSSDDGWKRDWSGNLQLYEKEIVANQGYVTKHPSLKPIKMPFYEWVAKSSANNEGLRGLELLFAYVYHQKGCPSMAQKILAHALEKPVSSKNQRLDFILDAIKRVTYDPLVLQQDGWCTKKAESPEGSMGGANLIGRRVIWQRHEAVIIAFTPDETWGSLWKALWIEDLETFDLEADEVNDALSKYEKKLARMQKKAYNPNVVAGATRKQATARFLVEGIEHGIVLALSKMSRGVFWPARVMHCSEVNSAQPGSRRNSAPTKAQVQVVFLAPFWNGSASSTAKADAEDPFSLGQLFEIETLEVTDITLKKYPFDSFSVEDIKSQFRFLGLPQAVMSRYLDANRLAMALREFARKHVRSNYQPGDEDAFASAQLTGSHAMSVLAPLFPHQVLEIPYDFILKQLPRANEHSILIDSDEADSETVIDIKSIVESMTPPFCFGRKSITHGTGLALSPERSQKAKLVMSPVPNFTPMSQDSENGDGSDSMWSISNFASELLIDLFETSQSSNNHTLSNLANMLNSLLLQMKELSAKFDNLGNEKRKRELLGILRQCFLVKGHGEEILASGNLSSSSTSRATVVTEWRKACERLYKRAVGKLKLKGAGNGYTAVISDSRCNGHITAENAFERPVRLPAAIKGAKRAGAGTDPNVLLLNSVDDVYVNLAEEKIIPKAHQRSYIKRLKAAVSAISDDQTGVQLTDDSEGEGGDDTKGSRGSYTAATVGVAAALMAVDKVVGGELTNAFCAVRPPGHHAGRELHPMRAVSNGFCLFNAAACAAIYAATPQSQGGLGLRRVCVIDFDLHHGNGTQDILCNTHDPRFLYVSMHVGGSAINGYDEEDTLDEAFHLPGSKTKEGIFPGRCGDTSPHDGVLNIPLGSKVTSSDVGTALVSQVLPKVETFSPDLIIISAGFDAHVNDPLLMGGLTAADFGRVTEVLCQLAYKTCSGRVLSVLEGGYGVPCCLPRTDIFLPDGETEKLLDLGDDLPKDMPDPVTNAIMRQKLNKCHAEGFVECVKEHVKSFVKFNKRK